MKQTSKGMRTREEIEKEMDDLSFGSKTYEQLSGLHSMVQTEILLDIRELLASPSLQKDFGRRQDALSPENTIGSPAQKGPYIPCRQGRIGCDIIHPNEHS